MTASLASISPMTPEQARQTIATLGLAWPNFLDRFETMEEYVAFAERLDPLEYINLGRAIEVLSKFECGESEL